MLQTKYFFPPHSFSIPLLSLVSLEETIRKADAKQSNLTFLGAKGKALTDISESPAECSKESPFRAQVAVLRQETFLAYNFISSIFPHCLKLK